MSGFSEKVGEVSGVGHQKWHPREFYAALTNGNDGEDRPGGISTRFVFESENAFRRLVRQECSCLGQCEFDLDGSKQGSRAQAGEDGTRSAG